MGTFCYMKNTDLVHSNYTYQLGFASINTSQRIVDFIDNTANNP